MNATDTFVLRAVNNDLPHPYFKKYNVCKARGYLPSEYDNEDCFEMDMIDFIEQTLRDKKPAGDKNG